jgi:hypothetical protein
MELNEILETEINLTKANIKDLEKEIEVKRKNLLELRAELSRKIKGKSLILNEKIPKKVKKKETQ